MSISLLREALTNFISTDLASRNENWTDIEDALNRIDDTDLTENSILYKIKHYGEGATLTDTEERFVADTIAAALAELAGAGRSTQTVKGNADAIALRELLANKVNEFQATPDDTHYPSEKLVKDALDATNSRLTGLDTLVYEGTTYRVSKRIENGHLVTTYTEVI